MEDKDRLLRIGDKIKVGDVVLIYSSSYIFPRYATVLKATPKSKTIYVVLSDGTIREFSKENGKYLIMTTGKRFPQIEKILKQMKIDEDEEYERMNTEYKKSMEKK